MLKGYIGVKHKIRNVSIADAETYGIKVKKDKCGRDQLTETKPGNLEAWDKKQQKTAWTSAKAKRHASTPQ